MNLFEAKRELEEHGYTIRKLNECYGWDSNNYCGNGLSSDSTVKSKRVRKTKKQELSDKFEKFGAAVKKIHSSGDMTEISLIVDDMHCKIEVDTSTGKLDALWVNDFVLMCRERELTNDEVKVLAKLNKIIGKIDFSNL